MGIDRTVDELIELARSNRTVAEALEGFEQIFDAYMIETPGTFVQKRKALLEAFRAKAPQTDLTWPIEDRLGALPPGLDP